MTTQSSNSGSSSPSVPGQKEYASNLALLIRALCDPHMHLLTFILGASAAPPVLRVDGNELIQIWLITPRMTID